MEPLIDINKTEDIFEEYRSTPIGLLLEYHNLSRPFEQYNKAKMLIGMCMDNRKSLRIPDNFAFIIRAGGANLKYSEFKVSYAIAIGEIQYIVLLSHNNCGMVNLNSRKDLFIRGLVEKAGWNYEKAEEHFNQFEPKFEIGNEIDFVLSEAKRLRLQYPKITVAPMHYNVDNNRLNLIRE